MHAAWKKRQVRICRFWDRAVCQKKIKGRNTPKSRLVYQISTDGATKNVVYLIKSTKVTEMPVIFWNICRLTLPKLTVFSIVRLPPALDMLHGTFPQLLLSVIENCQIGKTHFVRGDKVISLLSGSVDLMEAVCYNAKVMKCGFVPERFYVIFDKAFLNGCVREPARDKEEPLPENTYFWRLLLWKPDLMFSGTLSTTS